MLGEKVLHIKKMGISYKLSQLFRQTLCRGFFLQGTEVGRLCVINFNRTIYSLAEKKAKTFSVVLKAETEKTFVITQQLRSLVKNDFSAATNCADRRLSQAAASFRINGQFESGASREEASRGKAWSTVLKNARFGP